jgi:prepilin-type processing-associated H-X9-DG protein
MQRHHKPGFSLVGMLITVGCIVVLMVIFMTAVNKAVTGEGSPKQGTVRSVQDQMYLHSLYLSLATSANDYRGRFITPAIVTGSEDVTENTTANLFSLMVMENYAPVDQLISGNEYNPGVYADDDYDYLSDDPRDGVYWDPNFVADLDDESNTSFAHIPLYGRRLEKFWNNQMEPNYPILGNRGPRNGDPDPDSYTYGRDGTWGGHVVFADGHVEFLDTFTPGNVTFSMNGQTWQDNIYALESGENGLDAILAFTKEMLGDGGPILQWD